MEKLCFCSFQVRVRVRAKRSVYIVLWEKTEQNIICRFWERSAPNWERPVPSLLCFLTATTLHDLGSRLSNGNGPCSLGNGPSPPGTTRPRWQRPAANYPSAIQFKYWAYWGRSAPNLIYTHYISINSSH